MESPKYDIELAYGVIARYAATVICEEHVKSASISDLAGAVTARFNAAAYYVSNRAPGECCRTFELIARELRGVCPKALPMTALKVSLQVAARILMDADMEHADSLRQDKEENTLMHTYAYFRELASRYYGVVNTIEYDDCDDIAITKGSVPFALKLTPQENVRFDSDK